MKKYFTQYRTLEEEIKEGDFFSFVPIERQPLSGGIFQGHLVEDGWIEEWGIDRKFKQSACQKVKLFLCSRDIQIGDNTNVGIITHIYDTKVGVQTEQNKDYTILLTLKKDCYKVIGEISPGALSYVKEGQEFEPQDVLLANDSYVSCNSEELNEEEVKKIAERMHKEVAKVEHHHAARDAHGERTVYTTIYWTLPDCVLIKGPCGHFH